MEQDEGRECYIHNRPINFDEVPVTLISPIFGRLSDDLFTPEKDLRSEDFAPARDLANMLSKLAKDEASRNGAFLDWLVQTLPGIERKKLSGDASLKPYKVRPRLSTAIIKGEHEDSRYDYATSGHVELGDNLLRDGKRARAWRGVYGPSLAANGLYPSVLHAKEMLISRWPVLPASGSDCVLSYIHLLQYSSPVEAFQGRVLTLLRLSFVPTDRCELKH